MSQAAWPLSPLPRLRKPTRKKPRAGVLSCMRRHGALEPETLLPASSSVREPPEGRVLSFTSQLLRTPFLLQVRKQRPNQPNKTMGPSVGPPRAWPSLLFLSSSLRAQHAPLAAESHLTHATARGGSQILLVPQRRLQLTGPAALALSQGQPGLALCTVLSHPQGSWG